MSNENDELLSEVVSECIEHHSELETLLLRLEAAPGAPDPELINSIFRPAHSIKGLASFAGLTAIKELAHSFESVLNAYRQGRLTPTPPAVDILLRSTDFLKTLINDAVRCDEYEIAPYVAELDRILAEDPGSKPEDTSKQTVEIVPENQRPAAEAPDRVIVADSAGRHEFLLDRARLESLQARGQYVYVLALDLIRDAVEKGRTPEEFIAQLELLGEIHAGRPDLESGALDLEGLSSFPAGLLISSLIEPEMSSAAFEIPASEIETVEWAAGESAVVSRNLVRPEPESMPGDATLSAEAVSPPGKFQPGEKPGGG